MWSLDKQISINFNRFISRMLPGNNSSQSGEPDTPLSNIAGNKLRLCSVAGRTRSVRSDHASAFQTQPLWTRNWTLVFRKGGALGGRSSGLGELWSRDSGRSGRNVGLLSTSFGFNSFLTILWGWRYITSLYYSFKCFLDYKVSSSNTTIYLLCKNMPIPNVMLYYKKILWIPY